MALFRVIDIRVPAIDIYGHLQLVVVEFIPARAQRLTERGPQVLVDSLQPLGVLNRLTVPADPAAPAALHHKRECMERWRLCACVDPRRDPPLERLGGSIAMRALGYRQLAEPWALGQLAEVVEPEANDELRACQLLAAAKARRGAQAAAPDDAGPSACAAEEAPTC